jgi:short-chain fatty acids transporter
MLRRLAPRWLRQWARARGLKGLIQFPLYGGIAAMMTAAKGFGGESVAGQLAHVFANLTTASAFPVVIGVY